MSRIVEARGPAVDALKRYDPGLRVRWSHEKKKWAVDAPMRTSDPRWLTAPVRYEQIGEEDMWIERLLPEYSERNIQYKDRRYVVCYAKSVGWPLLAAIAQRDGFRHKKGAAGLFVEEFRRSESEKSKSAESRKSERVYAAWDRFKHDRRKLGAGAEDGTGVSIKGMA